MLLEIMVDIAGGEEEDGWLLIVCFNPKVNLIDISKWRPVSIVTIPPSSVYHP